MNLIKPNQRGVAQRRQRPTDRAAKGRATGGKKGGKARMPRTQQSVARGASVGKGRRRRAAGRARRGKAEPAKG
eukprot:2074379-Pyramimonas_sp.AAC.2